MNKREMITAIGKKIRMRNHDVQKVVEALFEVCTDELARGGRIEIQNFMVLEAQTKERSGNTGTLYSRDGQTPHIPATRTRIRISPSKYLRSRMKRGH